MRVLGRRVRLTLGSMVLVSYGTLQNSRNPDFLARKLRLKKWEFYVAEEMEENYKLAASLLPLLIS